MAGEWPQETGQGQGSDRVSLKGWEDPRLGGANQASKRQPELPFNQENGNGWQQGQAGNYINSREKLADRELSPTLRPRLLLGFELGPELSIIGGRGEAIHIIAVAQGQLAVLPQVRSLEHPGHGDGDCNRGSAPVIRCLNRPAHFLTLPARVLRAEDPESLPRRLMSLR